MDIIKTVKKSVLPNGHVLRMSITIEAIYFIFLECDVAKMNDMGYQYVEREKEMLWNGDQIKDANCMYDEFKNNPLIGGDSNDQTDNTSN